MKSLYQSIKERLLSLKLIFLFILFGTGSWVEINGIWVELSILVSKSPQQWKLPSYLTVVIQIANIGPIIYLLAHRYVRINSRKVVNEIGAIYFILSIGVIASFLLAFTWKETTTINGTSYSTALIVLSFFLATVDCTSSVTFLPFMAFFPKEYMTVYYIGEGMSGFFPSILSLIQGIGEQSYKCDEKVFLKNISVGLRNHNTGNMNDSMAGKSKINYKEVNVTKIVPSYFESEPRFTPQVFFLCISGMMLASLLSFIVLVRVKKQQDLKNAGVMFESSDDIVETDPSNNESVYNDIQLQGLKSGAIELCNEDTKTCITESTEFLSKFDFKTVCFLLLLNSLINGLSNGVLPALQSYACLPYGNSIYHFTLTLSALANPLCCFLYFFISVQSTKAILLGVSVYVISAGYTIGIAATSPCPLLNNSNIGGIVVLLVTVFGVGLVSYLKISISTVLRKHGYTALLWNGISVQVGSLIGALTLFPLVNSFEVFQQAAPCQQC